MAKITGKGHKTSTSSVHQSAKTRMWTLRNSETGRFINAKKSGSSFKGVKREN